MRWVLLLPLYRWGNGSTEGPSNLPKVTQLVNAELGIKLRVHVLTSMQFHLSKTSTSLKQNTSFCARHDANCSNVLGM